MHCGSDGFRISLKAAPGFFSKPPSLCHLPVLFLKHTPVTHWGGCKVSRGGEPRKCPRSPMTGQFRKEPTPGKSSLLSPQLLPLPHFCMETECIWGKTSVLLWTGFVCLPPLFYSTFTLTLPYGSLTRHLPRDNKGTVSLKDTIKLVDSKQFPGDNLGTTSLTNTIYLADYVWILDLVSLFFLLDTVCPNRAQSIKYLSTSLSKLLLIESEAHW